MKKEIFNRYVTKICERYSIKERELYMKNKTSSLADARHMLYFLCKETPIKIPYIKKYMMDNGYSIESSTINHGHKKITELIESDDYLKQVVEDIQQECMN